MAWKQELAINLNSDMRPVSATCNICGEMMPLPPFTLKDSADIISWLSGQFLQHKEHQHPYTPGGTEDWDGSGI